jgi:Resolvase, N terminal domain
MPIFGYARVSANGQNLADQIAELEAVVCGKIYREKISGATAGGPELAKLLRAIGLRRRGESFAPRRMALHSGFTERGERDACKGPALRSCARNRSRGSPSAKRARTYNVYAISLGRLTPRPFIGALKHCC